MPLGRHCWTSLQSQAAVPVAFQAFGNPRGVVGWMGLLVWNQVMG